MTTKCTVITLSADLMFTEDENIPEEWERGCLSQCDNERQMQDLENTGSLFAKSLC